MLSNSEKSQLESEFLVGPHEQTEDGIRNEHSIKMSMEKSSFRHGPHDLENFRLFVQLLISNLLTVKFIKHAL